MPCSAPHLLPPPSSAGGGGSAPAAHPAPRPPPRALRAGGGGAAAAAPPIGSRGGRAEPCGAEPSRAEPYRLQESAGRCRWESGSAAARNFGGPRLSAPACSAESGRRRLPQRRRTPPGAGAGSGLGEEPPARAPLSSPGRPYHCPARPGAAQRSTPRRVAMRSGTAELSLP